MTDKEQIKRAILRAQTYEQVEEIQLRFPNMDHDLYELVQDKIAELIDYENECIESDYVNGELVKTITWR